MKPKREIVTPPKVIKEAYGHDPYPPLPDDTECADDFCPKCGIHVDDGCECPEKPVTAEEG